MEPGDRAGATPFYGSTPTYRFILDGGEPGSQRGPASGSGAGDLAGMSELITDEVLTVFAVEASWAELPCRAGRALRGLADRLVFYVPGLRVGPAGRGLRALRRRGLPRAGAQRSALGAR